jgi:hypothetical protein
VTTRSAVVRTFSIGFALLACGAVSCSTKARDCDLAIDSLQRGGQLIAGFPKNAPERDQFKSRLDERVAEWGTAKTKIKNAEVLAKGEAVAEAARGHVRLLSAIDFAAAEKAAPPPPTANAGTDREQALREGVGQALKSLLGPLPQDDIDRLTKSADELERRRVALVDWCTPK